MFRVAHARCAPGPAPAPVRTSTLVLCCVRPWRDQVLGTTAADFVDFADRIDTVASEGSVAAVASERAIAEANEALEEAKRLVPRQAV